MARIHFSDTDLAHTRFVLSPMWELISSYCVLADPKRHAPHMPWVLEAQEAARDMDLTLTLIALPKRQGSKYFADFLAPYPRTTLPEFEAELELIRTTPPAEVRADIERNYGGLPSERFELFLRDPEAAMNALSDTLQLYWERVLASHWPRLRGLLEADILYRARILALYGHEALLQSFGPKTDFDGRRFSLGKWPQKELVLSGHGLLLIPSVFHGFGLGDLPAQEMLQYPARGAGLAWFGLGDVAQGSEALETLLGAQRAKLVRRLVVPATTGELAAGFGVTPSAVSQQLGWLRQAGLVATQRRGQRVYHELSGAGRGLLEAYEARVSLEAFGLGEGLQLAQPSAARPS